MTERLRRLEALGLTQWIRRGRRVPAALPDSSPAASAVLRVHRAVDAPVAVVLLLVGSPLTSGDPRAALLDRILGALEVAPERFRVLTTDDRTQLTPSQVDAHRVAGVPLLAFVGPGLSLPDAILLPTLAAMLEDPGAKRPAWERLKPLVGRLGP